MNKVKEIISSLEKTYGVDVMSLVEDYGSMLTLEQLSAKYNCTIHTVLVILTTLSLRRKKRHREADYKLFKAQLLDAADVPDTIVHEVLSTEKEIKELRRQVTVKEEALIRARLELKRLREVTRGTVKADLAFDELGNVLANYIASGNLLEGFRPKTVEVKALNGVPKEGLVVLYGDQHYGDVVSKKEVPYNEYNYKIAIQRVDKLIDNILCYPHQSDIVTVVNLNDSIKGLIHGGLFKTEGGFIESIIKAVEINVYFYSTLAAVYDNVVVYSTGDNHSRLTEEVAVDNKALDFARLIDVMTKKILSASKMDNVTIHTTEHGYHLFDVNNAPIVAFHGDTLRRFQVFNADQRALLQDHVKAMCGAEYRHSVNGHTHQPCFTYNQYQGVSITNGTLMGGNTYGTTSGFRPIRPSQTIFFVDPITGDIENIKFVALD